MIHRDSQGHNQLVFERRGTDNAHRRVYKTLKVSFDVMRDMAGNPPSRVHVDLTAASKETLAVFKDLTKQGFSVRDLFVSDVNGFKTVSILLERPEH